MAPTWIRWAFRSHLNRDFDRFQLGFLIPHTKAGTNGRYLAGLLIRNGLVKSEGLATPSFFLSLVYYMMARKFYKLKTAKLSNPCRD